MKIYTKTGDTGLTSLYDGSRVPKNSIPTSCLGDLDELNCNIGLAKGFWKEFMDKSLYKYYNGPGAGGLFYRDAKCINTGRYYEWYAFGEIMTEVQINIMKLSSVIATPIGNNINKWVDRVKLDTEIVDLIEKCIDRLESLLPPLKNFVVPSGNTIVSQIHICRSIARRCERAYICFLDAQEEIPEQAHVHYTIIRKYLNRLSDFLFVMSRFICMSLEIEEDLFLTNKKNT
jgi:cob(I)alamin adenosyltransferase